MNKKPLLIITAILLVAIVGATTTHFLFPYEPTQPPEVLDVNITEHDIEEVELANNMFGFDMLNELRLGASEKGEENENIFYSPYSIFSALVMTYEGAQGQTAKEMKSLFYFPDNEILRSGFADIYSTINDEGRNYELRTGNALWIKEDYELLDEYTQTVEDYYGGKSTNLDFRNQNEVSRQTINKFIEEQTNDRIKNLIPENHLPKDTKLVLTNAIYFLGNWKYEFDPEKTREEDFWITPDESIGVEMMTMSPDVARFNYTENDELQMIELPYEGGGVSMFIILPENEINDISHKLNNDEVEELMDEMRRRELSEISIPKFEIETDYNLNNVLSSMGMPSAFSEGTADFSGITGGRDLFIDSVLHKAFIEVDEEGTEAAAATGVVMRPTSAPSQPPPSFIANNPFVFFIRDNKTETNLFAGIVKDPTE